ncbi:MAG: hypothetical protein IFK92_12085, partial [Acidobacteria bacterium]|nr:hypothetical protein [Candidatus Sulfomarinibacter kjeldsenii]
RGQCKGILRGQPLTIFEGRKAIGHGIDVLAVSYRGLALRRVARADRGRTWGVGG